MLTVLASTDRANSDDRQQQFAVARAWAYGWAVSRGTDMPMEKTGCFQIMVNRSDRTMRYVVPVLDESLVQKLVKEEAQAGTWLKICADPDCVLPLLSNDWDIHKPEFLMWSKLARDAPQAIDGYRATTQIEGKFASIELIAKSGEIAASGQVAVVDSYAAFDKIVTAKDHQRRGLGRYVMSMLSNLSLELGAQFGTLVATEAGVALYTALSWSIVSPVVAAFCPTVRNAGAKDA
ncbi:GNAT family N-acetyltransferase [Celerinatantimonas yamalensis]|uniref:Acetyltransferase (GNAT) family protein n=1 Tax=Celerinatantimonas yamalensis TaxID=559956 RepID=A0ABW9G192_9GAMM